MEGAGTFPLFPIGEKVLYWSRSMGQWLPATVLGHNIQSGLAPPGLWSYELDVQPQAPPSLVVRRVPDGSSSEKTVPSTDRGHPQARPPVVPITCPWPMARHASSPCLWSMAPRNPATAATAATPPTAAVLPMPELPLHVTTRLPRHSLTATADTLMAAHPPDPATPTGSMDTPAASVREAREGAPGSPQSFRQVKHPDTPELREGRRSSPVSPARPVAQVVPKSPKQVHSPVQVMSPGKTITVAPPAWPATRAALAATNAAKAGVGSATAPTPATVVAPAGEAAQVALKPPGSGPIIITVPSNKLRPMGNRATVPVAGHTTPKEPNTPLLVRQSARMAPAVTPLAPPSAGTATPAPAAVRTVAAPLSPPRVMPRARVQVMPPATPPREHRMVMPLGVQAAIPRPLSLLRGAAYPATSRSMEMLSPKDPTPQLPMLQSLLVPSTRSASPLRPASPPVHRMVPTLSSRSLQMPIMPASVATPSAPAPRSPLSPGIEVRGPRSTQFQWHQWGIPPERWGIHFDQLLDLEQHRSFQRAWTTREVVSQIIWPETAGKGIGYALWRNFSQPLAVAVMVSHAWDDTFVDLLLALSVAPQQGPLWVASCALYQAEENLMQISMRPVELMTQVLRGKSMLCVLSTVDVYERLWCLFEMSLAVELGVEVTTSRKPKGRGAWALDEAFLTACGKPVDSLVAKCGDGPQGRDGAQYEQALRKAIESTPKSYDGINRAVEMACLTSLNKYREQLCGGGWSTTGIGKQYSDVIGDICMRLGIHQPEVSPTPATPIPPMGLPMRPKNSILSSFPPGLATKRDLTPRTGFRQHWGKITSL